MEETLPTSRRFWPGSGEGHARKIDGRSWQGRLLRETKDKLKASAGGLPAALAPMAIERAAMLTLYLAELDRKALASGGMGEAMMREYLALSDALSRAMDQLAGLRR